MVLPSKSRTISFKSIVSYRGVFLNSLRDSMTVCSPNLFQKSGAVSFNYPHQSNGFSVNPHTDDESNDKSVRSKKKARFSK